MSAWAGTARAAGSRGAAAGCLSNRADEPATRSRQVTPLHALPDADTKNFNALNNIRGKN